MTPTEFCEKFPRLYHLGALGCTAGIRKHGLLSTCAILDALGAPADLRRQLTENIRTESIQLVDDSLGKFEINDNSPLSLKKLEMCLEDGMRPVDWLRLLNRKVFFWPTRKKADSLINALRNRNRGRELVTFDTQALVKDHWATLALCPINSGATLYNPAKRGMSTFTSAAEKPFREWQRQRGLSSPDKVKEIIIDYAATNAGNYIISTETV